MTYAQNNTILASDSNLIRGETGSFAGSVAFATNKAGFLWGKGFGDRGYGQVSPSTSNVAVENVIGGEWRELQSILTSLASWQGSSTANIPPASAFAIGQPISAHRTADGNAYDLASALALLDSSRLNHNFANFTLNSNVASSTRNAAWGSPGEPGIAAEFTCNFASEDDARYFFNSGGQIRLTLNHPNTSTSQDVAWYYALLNMNIAFQAHSTSALSGSTGTGSSLGYYELTSGYQRVYDASNSSSGVYSQNDYYLDVKSNNIVGTNGGRGSQLVFRITMVDEHSNAFADNVNAGTSAAMSYIKASSGLSINNVSIANTLSF